MKRSSVLAIGIAVPAVAIALAPFLYLVWQFQRTKAAAVSLAHESDELVQAIYSFHDDCGLWPQYLEDLKPEYLKEIPIGCTYQWPGYAPEFGPTLNASFAFHMRLSYSFPPPIHETEGWHLYCEGDRVRVQMPIVVRTERLVPSDERRSRMRAELQKRIAREPNDAEHAAEMERQLGAGEH